DLLRLAASVGECQSAVECNQPLCPTAADTSAILEDERLMSGRHDAQAERRLSGIPIDDAALFRRRRIHHKGGRKLLAHPCFLDNPSCGRVTTGSPHIV